MKRIQTDIVQVGAARQFRKQYGALVQGPNWKKRFPVESVVDLDGDLAKEGASYIAGLDSNIPVLSTSDLSEALMHSVGRGARIIVNITTSASSHDAVVEALAEADTTDSIRGIIVEKPIGGSLDKARAIQQICTSKGWIAGVQEQMYYSSVLEKARTILAGFFSVNREFGTNLTPGSSHISGIQIDFSKNRVPRSLHNNPENCNLDPSEWIAFEGPHELAVMDTLAPHARWSCDSAHGESMLAPVADLDPEWVRHYSDFCVENTGLGLPSMVSIPYHAGGSARYTDETSGMSAHIYSRLDTSRKREAKVFFDNGAHYLLLKFDPGTDDPYDHDRGGSVSMHRTKDGSTIMATERIPDNCLAESLIRQVADICSRRIPRSSLDRNIKLLELQAQAVEKMKEKNRFTPS